MAELLSGVTEFLFAGQGYHLYFEFLLLLWVFWLISKKNRQDEIFLTENEVDVLIRDYEPERLVSDVPLSHYALKPRIIRGKANKYINVDGINCLNFATHNYLGFIGNDEIEKEAVNTVMKYGVGSCGPRGFYGTSEVHLELEKCLANFMGAEDACVYSYAFSTISSAIPAYAKRGDIIFVDEKANFSIQKGLDASRSMINFFKHNDMEDLERILETTRQEDLKNPRKAQKSRRFLVVEGIYANTGKMCPLPDIVQLKNKYKLRLFIDESNSFCVLGKTGRGITEHFGIPMSEVDLVMASMECALASIGGFCVGTSFIVDHQRLSGLGYCFSASLPPMLAIAAMEGVKVVDQHPEILERLQQMCVLMHNSLNGSSIISKMFTVTGDALSPLHLLLLKQDYSSSNPQSVISEILDTVLLEGKAVSRASQLESDTSKTGPCIRIITSVQLVESDISSLIDTLESACVTKFPEIYTSS